MPASPRDDAPRPDDAPTASSGASHGEGAHRAPARHSHLTRRGRIALTILGVALVLALVAAALHALRDSGAPTPVSGPSASSSASASPEASTSPSPSASPSGLLPGATRDQGGYVHSNYTSSGIFADSTLAIAPRHRTAVLHTYIVEVETSLSRENPDLAPNAVATQVAQVLNDPRGWTGMTSGRARGVSFQLVSDPRKAQFVIHLASAQTVTRRCPLNTLNLWSCDAGSMVLLNADRWLYAVPSYPSVEEYREYQVNHEVGHFLGFGHQYVCGRDHMAPTMMQQSKGLHGCTANPWPTVA